MQPLVHLLPYAHITFAVLLASIYFYRGILLINNSAKARSKGLISLSSLMALSVFFTGVALAFVMRLSFTDGFVFTKMIALLVFIGLGVAAFFPHLPKRRSIMLLKIDMLLFAYLVLVATKGVSPLF